jgi:PLD-like domain
MVALDSITGFVSTLKHAQSIALTAYTLRDGRVLQALEAAARGGADVRVRLERDPLDDAGATLHQANAASIAALRAAGAKAEATEPGEPALHLKAAVVDGVAWLDDRNWASGGAERILRDDDPDDVAAVTSAVSGGPGADGHLATTKSGAQWLEADVIRAAGAGPLVVESESFGTGAIYNALLHRAQAHEPTRLIVAGREVAEAGSRSERSRLEHLAALGVEIRVGDVNHGDLDEKLAVSSDDCWVGSANATYAREAFGEQRDWGVASREPGLVDGLRAAFERNWSAARPLATVLQ